MGAEASAQAGRLAQSSAEGPKSQGEEAGATFPLKALSFFPYILLSSTNVEEDEGGRRANDDGRRSDDAR